LSRLRSQPWWLEVYKGKGLQMNVAIQVTMYLNESDKWRQILQILRRENVAG
jgi:hypothetical protein